MSQRKLKPGDSSFPTQDKSGGGLLPSIQGNRPKIQGVLVIDED